MRLTVLDWETLGIKPNAKVIAIGACTFNLDGSGDDAYLSATISKEGQENRSITPSTISWWEQQSKEAQNASYTAPIEHSINLETAVHALVSHIVLNESKGIIGNGIGFDNVILANICSELKIAYPVPFWADYDLRTMKLMANVNKPEWPEHLTPHNALHDVMYEASAAKYYWNILHGEK